MKLSIETCINALNVAAINRKQAIQLELSVGLAVFLLHGSTSKEGRAMLTEAYAAAGYRCTHINEMDYKTINRRINATAALFEKLPVAKWVGKHDDTNAIRSICDGLEPYELFTIADVQRFCAPPAAPAAAHTIKVKPDLSILDPVVSSAHTGQSKVLQQFRRAADQAHKNAKHIATEHLTVTIPEHTPREEIIELAMQLLSLVKETNKELLTA